MTTHLNTAIAIPCFADLFDTPLPRGVRDIAADMPADAAVDHFGYPPGPVRLGQWECTDAPTASSRLGLQARHFRATIAVGDRIATATAEAPGPLGALTAMLYDRGIAVEMLAFHQLQSGAATATFIHGSNGLRDEWAVGWSPNAGESALRAVVACANRLYR